MSLRIRYILQIKHNEHFSLIKRGKKRLFGFYKTLRFSKQTNHTQNNIYDKSPFNILNNLIISKEINLNYISSFKQLNIPDENKNILLNNAINKYQIKNVIFKNKKKLIYHKKDKTRLLCNKSNVLIKPKMINDIKHDTDDVISNQKFEKKSFINNYNNFNSNIIFNNNYFFNYANKNNKDIYNQLINNNNNKNFSFNLFQNSLQNNLNYKNINQKNIITDQNTIYKIKKQFIFPDEYIIPHSNIPVYSNKNIFKNYFKFNKNQSQLIESTIQNNSKFCNQTKNNILIEEKLNNNTYSIFNTKETSFNNNETKNIITKGRKTKYANKNIESKHTKYSTDNMMRKIKNKVIESSRLLINKVLKEEFKYSLNKNFPYKELLKIKGSFSQELNIKYNFWFYQITIKEIFLLEISNKYATNQKSSNKELINYIYSDINKNNFIKTKQLLETKFHQYYHDIFLDENEDWKKNYGILDKNNIFNINYLLKNLEEEEKKESNYDDKKYINDINELAHNYESYFLDKKPRNLDFNNKKNEFIKSFLLNSSSNEKYEELQNDVKKIKDFYTKRKILMNLNKNDKKVIDETNENQSFIKNDKNNEKIKINYIDEIKNEFIINKPMFCLKEEEKQKHETFIFEKNKNNNFINDNLNKKEKISENDFKKEIKEEIKNIRLCNRKRKREKIKYFKSFKNLKKLDNTKQVFLINKPDN